MSVDVSTLQVKVVSDGIQETSKKLGGLSKSAGNAEERVDRLTSKIMKLVGVQNTATAAATGFNAALSSSATATNTSSSATKQLLAQMERLIGVSTDISKGVTALGTAMQKGTTETDKNTAALRYNTNAMKDAHAMARGLTGSLGALWLTYGNMVPLAVGAAIGASFKQIVTVGADVEHTLEGIRVRAGGTYEEIGALRDVVNELGQGVYGPREIAKSLEAMALAGLNAKEQAIAIKDALNLATVGGTSIEKAAFTLVQVGEALGYDAKSYSIVSDVIAKTAAISMSSVESLSESFKSASAVGKLYGATITDIGVSLAALSNLGISGSAAGTSLKNFYKELSVESKKVKDTLASMKMTPADLKDANGQFLDMVTVIERLDGGLNRLTESQQAQAIQMLSNERGMKTIVELLDLYRQKTDEGRNALIDMRNELQNATGYAAINAALMAQTVQSQFKSVGNTLETSLGKAFSAISPQMLVLTNRLKEIFNSQQFSSAIQTIALALSSLAVAVAENVEGITTLVAALLGLKVLGTVLGLVANVTAAVRTLTIGFEGAAAAARIFQASMGLVGVVLSVVGTAWAIYEAKKASATAQGDSMKVSVNSTVDALNQEADRLEKVNDQLRSGVDAKKADAIATMAQAQAQIEKNKADMMAPALTAQKSAQAALDAHMNSNAPRGVGFQEKYKELASNLDKTTKAYQATQKAAEEYGVTHQKALDRTFKAGRENWELTEKMRKQKEEAAHAAQTGTGTLNNGVVDKKAIAEANSELKRYSEILTDVVAKTKEQQELAARMAMFGPDYEKMHAGARRQAELEAELYVIEQRRAQGLILSSDKIREGKIREILASKEMQALLLSDRTLAIEQEKVEATRKIREGRDADLKAVSDEVERWEAKAAAINGAKEATAEYTLAKLEQQRATSTDLEEIMHLSQMIDKYKQLIPLKQAVGDAEEIDKARKSFDKLFDKGRALDFGNTFTQTFGKVGKSIDNAGKALDKYWKRQDKIGDAQKDLDKASGMSAKERAMKQMQYDNMTAANTVDMYASMAGAVSDFFSEKTAAYKIAHGIEMGLRAVELASAIQLAMTKIGLLEAEQTVKQFTTVSGIFLDNTETTNSLANSALKTSANTTEGVSKAFAQMGVFGFVGAAAIIAFMMAMGFSGGGGGSAPNLSEERQERQGTGTVLGDESAKSESVTNALEALKENSVLGLEHSGKMLIALRNIDNGIKTMAVAVAGTAGLRGTAADQRAAGVGSSSSFLGFSKSSTTLLDSGLTFDATRLAELLAGGSIGVQGYQDIERKKSSFFGLSKSSKTSRTLTDVDSALQRQIDLTIRNLAGGTLEAATALGMNSDIVTRQLQDFVVDLGDISLKGLSGDDIEKELGAAFSKLGDQMANAILPGFRDFQRMGEGGFETLVRLASGVESAKKELDNLGISMIAYQDIVNKQGDVDAELIRQSIALKEAGSNIASMMNVMDGEAQDLVDSYRKLVDLRGSLRAMDLANDVSNAMLRGSQSLDDLLGNVNSFLDGFYTDAEKQAVRVSKLREQFAALGVAMPTTAAGFRSLVEQLMRGGERTQDLAARVLALSDAFIEATDAAKEAHDAAVDTARDELSEAYNRESEALEDTIEKMNGFIDSLKEFKESLIMSDQSPLSTTEKYVTALAKYNETYQKAMGGDAKAIEEFQGVAEQLLKFSRDMYASGDQYTTDFQNVLKNIDEVMGVADQQVDTATQQLNALKESVKHLIDIDETVKTVAETLARLESLLSGTPTIDGSHANGLSNVPYDGYVAELHAGERVLTAQENRAYSMDYSRYTSNSNDALVAEIKALRTEVSTLRQEQADQTNRMIGANYDAQERNAQDVVEGVKSAAEETAYAARTQPALN